MPAPLLTLLIYIQALCFLLEDFLASFTPVLSRVRGHASAMHTHTYMCVLGNISGLHLSPEFKPLLCCLEIPVTLFQRLEILLVGLEFVTEFSV